MPLSVVGRGITGILVDALVWSHPAAAWRRSHTEMRRRSRSSGSSDAVLIALQSPTATDKDREKPFNFPIVCMEYNI
jgi:hypothetical protein